MTLVHFVKWHVWSYHVYHWISCAWTHVYTWMLLIWSYMDIITTPTCVHVDVINMIIYGYHYNTVHKKSTLTFNFIFWYLIIVNEFKLLYFVHLSHFGCIFRCHSSVSSTNRLFCLSFSTSNHKHSIQTTKKKHVLLLLIDMSSFKCFYASHLPYFYPSSLHSDVNISFASIIA